MNKIIYKATYGDINFLWTNEFVQRRAIEFVESQCANIPGIDVDEEMSNIVIEPLEINVPEEESVTPTIEEMIEVDKNFNEVMKKIRKKLSEDFSNDLLSICPSLTNYDQRTTAGQSRTHSIKKNDR